MSELLLRGEKINREKRGERERRRRGVGGLAKVLKRRIRSCRALTQKKRETVDQENIDTTGMTSFFRMSKSAAGSKPTVWSDEELINGKIGHLYDETLYASDIGLDAKSAYNNNPGSGMTGDGMCLYCLCILCWYISNTKFSIDEM